MRHLDLFCIFVHLSIYLPNHLALCPSAILPICHPAHLPSCPSANPPVSCPAHLLAISPAIHQSTRVPVCHTLACKFPYVPCLSAYYFFNLPRYLYGYGSFYLYLSSNVLILGNKKYFTFTVLYFSR
jgi:hypothetical protein